MLATSAKTLHKTLTSKCYLKSIWCFTSAGLTYTCGDVQKNFFTGFSVTNSSACGGIEKEIWHRVKTTNESHFCYTNILFVCHIFTEMFFLLLGLLWYIVVSICCNVYIIIIYLEVIVRFNAEERRKRDSYKEMSVVVRP